MVSVSLAFGLKTAIEWGVLKEEPDGEYVRYPPG